MFARCATILLLLGLLVRAATADQLCSAAGWAFGSACHSADVATTGCDGEDRPELPACVCDAQSEPSDVTRSDAPPSSPAAIAPAALVDEPVALASSAVPAPPIAPPPVAPVAVGRALPLLV